MKNNRKTIGFLTIPIGLTIAAYILIFNVSKLPLSWITILQYISYIFFLVGIILGARFNKSKVFFLCIILGLSQMVLSSEIVHKLPKIFYMLSFLIPIDIFLFSILRERGILTSWGKIRFGLILAEIILIWWAIQPGNSYMESLIYYNLVNWKITQLILIPQISILLFFGAFLFLNIRMFLKPTLIDSSLIGVVLTVLSGLLLKDEIIYLQVFFAMSGLILIIGVVEISYSMAYLDELTGIPARRALKEALMKLDGQYVIAMLDIDFFKKFNDKYGHDAGDKVLQMVASNLQKVGGGGRAFRYGGEEFTILFSNTTLKQGISHLETLRESIAKQQYIYKKKSKVKGKEKVVSQKFSVTISIGVAEKNDKYISPEAVMQAADKALYRAKNKGRNCVSK